MAKGDQTSTIANSDQLAVRLAFLFNIAAFGFMIVAIVNIHAACDHVLYGEARPTIDGRYGEEVLLESVRDDQVSEILRELLREPTVPVLSTQIVWNILSDTRILDIHMQRLVIPDGVIDSDSEQVSIHMSVLWLSDAGCLECTSMQFWIDASGGSLRWSVCAPATGADVPLGVPRYHSEAVRARALRQTFGYQR